MTFTRVAPLVALGLLLLPARGLAEDKFFDSNGVRIRYVEQGTGAPVILMHGNGATLEEWTNLGIFQNLSRDFRVIAFDARGHGKSDKPHDPQMYGREMSLDVLRLMDHLGIQRAHLIGYSMGAQTAAHLIVIKPERFVSAILLSAPGRFNWTDEDWRRAEQNAVERERDCISVGMMRARGPIGAAMPSEEELKRRSAECMANPNFDRFALAAVGRGQISQTMTPAEVAAVKVPTLGVVGTLDSYVKDFQELKKLRPDLQLLVLEGATHGGPQAAARRLEFLAAAREFLMSHRR